MDTIGAVRDYKVSGAGGAANCIESETDIGKTDGADGNLIIVADISPSICTKRFWRTIPCRGSVSCRSQMLSSNGRNSSLSAKFGIKVCSRSVCSWRKRWARRTQATAFKRPFGNGGLCGCLVAKQGQAKDNERQIKGYFEA